MKDLVLGKKSECSSAFVPCRRDVDEIAKASGVHTFREEGKGDEIEGDVETVVKASAEVMATRTILTAKRKNPTASAASAAVKESAAPVKGGETEAARNPFAAGFAPANQWKCTLFAGSINAVLSQAVCPCTRTVTDF